jgi:pimeloyl-ACP methyl ester carboxylesterase
VFFLGIYLFQEHLIFNPERLSDKYRFSFDIDFEEKFFTTKDGTTLNALFFDVKNPKGVIFYHHGNTGHLESWGLKAKDFTSKGYAVLFYDYRGYGKSNGKIKSEKMLFSDAKSIYRELLKNYEEKKIIVYGASLGTGIASYIAANNNPGKLILETPYFNFNDLAKFHYPYLPCSAILNYHLRIDKYLPKVNSEVSLFHGTEDETVPYTSSLRLAKLSDKIKFYSIEGGSHNNLNSHPIYHQHLEKILN